MQKKKKQKHVRLIVPEHVIAFQVHQRCLQQSDLSFFFAELSFVIILLICTMIWVHFKSTSGRTTKRQTVTGGLLKSTPYMPKESYPPTFPRFYVHACQVDRNHNTNSTAHLLLFYVGGLRFGYTLLIVMQM